MNGPCEVWLQYYFELENSCSLLSFNSRAIRKPIDMTSLLVPRQYIQTLRNTRKRQKQVIPLTEPPICIRYQYIPVGKLEEEVTSLEMIVRNRNDEEHCGWRS